VEDNSRQKKCPSCWSVSTSRGPGLETYPTLPVPPHCEIEIMVNSIPLRIKAIIDARGGLQLWAIGVKEIVVLLGHVGPGAEICCSGCTSTAVTRCSLFLSSSCLRKSWCSMTDLSLLAYIISLLVWCVRRLSSTPCTVEYNTILE
jgi:hypothetical protein